MKLQKLALLWMSEDKGQNSVKGKKKRMMTHKIQKLGKARSSWIKPLLFGSGSLVTDSRKCREKTLHTTLKESPCADAELA